MESALPELILPDLLESQFTKTPLKPIISFDSSQLIELHKSTIKQFEIGVSQANGKIFHTSAALSKYIQTFGFRLN